MPNYHRHFQPGGTFFFTVVTYKRHPIFNTSSARQLLGEAFRTAMERYPFSMVAVCLLPDHLHCIWTLPENDINYSIRWGFIKSFFTHRYNDRDTSSSKTVRSREKRREKGVWQRRFWEHFIRDELDLEVHFDYIHYNPVKHGYVQYVDEWEWSSFHRYLELGWYSKGWNDQNKGEKLIISDIWD
jgi:putative transposase